MILRINARTERLRNTVIDFFNNVTLNMRYDSVAGSFSFSCYFNPDNPDHKQLFHMSHFHIATIEHNNEKLLTGYVLSNTFNQGSVKRLASISGYSLPGTLEDCEIPVDIPLQSDGLNLRQIAQKLLNPFGIKMIVDSSVSSRMDKVYEKVTASENQTIKSYLSELATQRNILITHDENGSLVFTESKDKKPILNIDGTGIPVTRTVITINGQQMHSHIRVIRQADVDAGNAGSEEVTNPYVTTVYRPKVATQSSGDDVDTLTAAKMLLAQEIKNIKLTINLDRWVIDGKVIRPNNYITVRNPEVYLYEKTTWFIESVTLTGNEKQQVAVLNCVLPEVYNGKTPKDIFG